MIKNDWMCSVLLATLLCSLISVQAETGQPEKSVPIALAISGGISLGAYEAGLNWAIVRQLKLMRERPELRSDIYPAELSAISGASAGGINALVSAMSWCMDEQGMAGVAADTLTDNLFRDIWLDVGFANLLPENPRAYAPGDGLLSRRAFHQVIDRIRVLLEQPIYRADCAIPVALTVTRTQPEVMEVGGIRVRNQRFVIPFILKSSTEQPGKIRIESYLVNADDPMLGNVIYLQSVTPGSLQIDKDSVIQAVLASSAFPVAFGRVQLNYCSQQPGQSEPWPHLWPCPAGFVADSGHFVDGGVFDNIPLGVARALMEQKPKPDEVQYNYIYLDPASRRPFRAPQESTEESAASYGLVSQLSFVGGAIASGEEYELYNVLRTADWSGNGPRRILLTSRHPPITGEFLAHFGAFIDKSFRVYDYYAGVYDAIDNIARYRCFRKNAADNNQSRCQAEQAQLVYTGLLPDESQLTPDFLVARETLSQLAQHEHQGMTDQALWEWSWKHTDSNLHSNVILVAATLIASDRIEPGRDPELRDFIHLLPASYDTRQSDYIIRRILKLRHEDELKWFYPLASRASLRLLELEKHEQTVTGDSLRGLMGMAAFGVETALGDTQDLVWNQSTALNDWYQLIPYEIAYDISNFGWSISWEPSWRFHDDWSMNIKLTPIAVQRSFEQRTVFNQVDMFFSHHNQSSLFSSWGIGPSYNHQRDQHTGYDRENVGYALYAGFFGDKVRLTLGKRAESDGFFGDEVYLYLGITDLPGISYWIRQIYW